MTNNQLFKIGINCDMGEDIRLLVADLDSSIMPLIDSCNIACGYHGSDIKTIENTVDLAIKHNVCIGAHPSYYDPEGFGRRKMDLDYDTLYKILKEQIHFLKTMVEEKEGVLRYVKPHGALYHAAMSNKKESTVMVDVIQSFDENIALMGLPNSKMHTKAKAANVQYITEAFGDRLYKNSNELVPRDQKNAVIKNPKQIVSQIKSIMTNNLVTCQNGKVIPIKADSICVHSDNPAILDALVLLRVKNDAKTQTVKNT